MLGPLEVRAADGAPATVTGARLRTVLLRLALDAGRPVAPDVLVDAVWGDAPPADAANALQTLVSRLRRALGDTTAVEQSPAGYRLAVDPDAVDALRFQALGADGARALRQDDAATAVRLLREALALWRGPLPPELLAAAPAAATRLADLRVAATVDRVGAELQLGDADAAVPELAALSTEHPLDERIAAQLVAALAAAGRQADALRAYERMRERLADELGVDPSAELRAAHLAVLRGEPGSAAAPDVGRARRTNLKAQLTSFVGREDEAARVAKALDENRLVTVVGPGGAGKTRLASEVGATLTARDGVWLAELAPVTDPAAVPQAVLAALGFRDRHLIERRPGQGLADTMTRLLDALGDKDSVLVLDNCEHLVDAAAALAEHLLHQCPQLRVLATSREPLAITGEVVLALPTLGRPAPDTPAAFAIDYPAVRLFADRAAAASPDFVLDDAAVAPVIEIVRRLDGLPLAIELAAARLRTLPVAEIAARLDDRFRLLTGGSRTALPRHRTLHAVVEWSWELLTDAERRLVERLAVFAAGATADSAVAVCAGGELPAEDVADLLSSLIDKSLLQRVGDGDRVRMLETIREFGIERLAERGELAAARLRHAEYFDRLLADAEPHLTRRDQLPWLDRLTAERDNIAAALRFRCSTGDGDGALSIAVGLAGFAMMLGNHSEVAGWTSEALAAPGWTDRRLRTTAEALLALHTTAVGTASAGIDDAMQQLGDAAGRLDLISSAEHPMNGVLRIAVSYFTNDTELTERVLDEELASPDEWVRAVARMFRANLAENNGELDGHARRRRPRAGRVPGDRRAMGPGQHPAQQGVAADAGRRPRRRRGRLRRGARPHGAAQVAGGRGVPARAHRRAGPAPRRRVARAGRDAPGVRRGRAVRRRHRVGLRAEHAVRVRAPLRRPGARPRTARRGHATDRGTAGLASRPGPRPGHRARPRRPLRLRRRRARRGGAAGRGRVHRRGRDAGQPDRRRRRCRARRDRCGGGPPDGRGRDARRRRPPARRRRPDLPRRRRG